MHYNYNISSAHCETKEVLTDDVYKACNKVRKCYNIKGEKIRISNNIWKTSVTAHVQINNSSRNLYVESILEGNTPKRYLVDLLFFPCHFSVSPVVFFFCLFAFS